MPGVSVLSRRPDRQELLCSLGKEHLHIPGGPAGTRALGLVWARVPLPTCTLPCKHCGARRALLRENSPAQKPHPELPHNQLSQTSWGWRKISGKPQLDAGRGCRSGLRIETALWPRVEGPSARDSVTERSPGSNCPGSARAAQGNSRAKRCQLSCLTLSSNLFK